jgi:CRP-like cAMP-binding protein
MEVSANRISVFASPAIVRPSMPLSKHVVHALADFRATRIGAALGEEAARTLLELADPVSFVKGARLVEQADPARGAYVLRAGRVEARVTLPGGGERTVAAIDAGEMFGETALIEGGICSASVVAVAPVDGWFIERDAFRALVAARNAAALEWNRALAMSLVQRLGALNAQLLKQVAPEDRVVREAPPAGDPLSGVARHHHATFDAAHFLPVLPFFADFEAAEIENVCANARYLELPRGHWLFAAGQSASHCFLVVRGAVEAVAQVSAGANDSARERRMAVLGPGTFAGYLSVLRGGASGAVHGAGARARETVTLLEFSAAEFLERFQGTTRAEVKFQHAVLRALLQSLTRSNGQMARLVTQAGVAA